MTQKFPSWVQFSDDLWGDAVGGESDHSDWLRSLDAPELPPAALDPLPEVNFPLRQVWIAGGEPRWLVLYDAPGADRRDGEHAVFGDLLQHE